MPQNRIDGLIQEITELITQFKSYEDIARETLIASNNLIDAINDNSKLGEKNESSTDRRSTDNTQTDDKPSNIFAQSVDIFSSSVTTFKTAVDKFTSGVGGSVKEGKQQRESRPAREPRERSGGGGSDLGAIAGLAATGFVGYKMIGALSGLLGAGKGIFGGVNLQGPLSQITQMEKLVVKMRDQFGFTDEAIQGIGSSIIKATIETSKWGVSGEQLAGMMKGLSTATGRARELSTENLQILGAASSLMGGDTKSAVEFFDKMDTLGMSMSSAGNLMGEMKATAGRMGVDAVKHSASVRNNMRMVNSFHFRGGVRGLSSMAAYALRMRADMTQIEQSAKRFRTIEDSVQATAGMQMLGGAGAMKFGNMFENMWNAYMDPEAKIRKMAGMGTHHMNFDEKTGINFNSIHSRMIAEQQALALGIDFDEFANIMRRGVSESHIAAALSRNKDGGLTDAHHDTIKSKGEYVDLGGGRMGWGVQVYDQATGGMVMKDIETITAEDMKHIQANSETNLIAIASHTRTIAERYAGGLQTASSRVASAITRVLPPNLYTNLLDSAKIVEDMARVNSLDDFKKTSNEAFNLVSSAATETWGHIEKELVPKLIAGSTVVGELVRQGWAWIKGDGWGSLKGVWETSLKPIFKSIWGSFKEWFISTVWPKLKTLLEGGLTFLGNVISDALPFGKGRKRRRERRENEAALSELEANEENQERLRELRREHYMSEGADVNQESRRGAGTGVLTGALTGAAIGAAAGAGFLGVGAIPGAIGGALIGAVGGTAIGGARGSNRDRDRRTQYILDNFHESHENDYIYEKGNNTIRHLNPNDSIIAARPNDDIATWLKNIGVSTALANVPQAGGAYSHSGSININLSGCLQLQDPNGNIRDWNNPQLISDLTEKISMEITKKMNYSSSGDGRILYGGYAKGMFG